MVLAADYPLLDAFWTMLIFFLWVVWFWLLITVFADIFRRHDMSGWVKALWVVFVIVVPYLGVLIYLITQGRHMSERNVRDARAYQAQMDEHIRSVASTGNGAGRAAEIEKANQLLSSGAITQAEYETLKQKALAS
jgi:Short C-terminal domain/Phospholipase_D-nuclease N-terminal